jgi:hypothetical protein
MVACSSAVGIGPDGATVTGSPDADFSLAIGFRQSGHQALASLHHLLMHSKQNV